MVQPWVNYQVLTEVISCDPSLPWSPTWPEQREKKWATRVSGGALIPVHCSVPGGRKSPHLALIPGSKQGYHILSWESPDWLTASTHTCLDS